MAKSKVKVVHFIIYRHDGCRTACDAYFITWPIEDSMDEYNYKDTRPHGTFNPKKVTCKRCLKHPFYKEALDKVNNPLLYWKELI